MKSRGGEGRVGGEPERLPHGRPHPRRRHADVELRQMEPEHVHLPLHRPHLVQPGVRAAVLLERAGDEGEVVAELAGRAVADAELGGGAAAAAHEGVARRGEPRADPAQLLAIRLVGRARLERRGEDGVEGIVALQRLEELSAHPRATPALRETRAEPVDLADVQRHGARRLRERGVERDLGGDVGVPVHVGADPRPEAEEGRNAQPWAVRRLERALERRVDARHEGIEDLFEVEENVLHFVADARFFLADLVGLPERRDLFAERARIVFGFGGERARPLEALEELRDPAVLVEDGAPLRLGRVSREDELDARAREQGLRPFARQVLLQCRDELRQRPQGGLAGARVVAVAADTVVLLGEVHELEVVRERARDALGRRRVERGDGGAERDAVAASRALRGAALLGEGADPLLELEERPSFLLDERFAEDPAERGDVAAERLRTARREVARHRPDGSAHRAAPGARLEGRLATGAQA